MTRKEIIRVALQCEKCHRNLLYLLIIECRKEENNPSQRKVVKEIECKNCHHINKYPEIEEWTRKALEE